MDSYKHSGILMTFAATATAGFLAVVIYRRLTQKTTKVIDIEKRLKLLQEEVGEKPEVKVGEFENWGKTKEIANLLICTPTSLDEVQRLVRAAKKLKLRVRCAGAGHSWAPLFPDEGNILLKLNKLQRHDGPQIELQKVNGQNYVTVMSGTTVEEFVQFELDNKVTLPCNTIVTQITVGGAVAPGCHGTGWNFKAVPDYLVKIRIIDSDGKLRCFSKEDDPDMFKAVQTNLGLFGIMYDMTFDLQHEMVAESKNEFHHTVGNLLYDAKYMKNLVTSNGAVEIFWWPFNGCSHFSLNDNVCETTHGRLTRNEWNPKDDETWVKLLNIKENASDVKLEGEYLYYFLDVCEWLESKGMDHVTELPQRLTPSFLKAGFNYIKETIKPVLFQQWPHAVHFGMIASKSTACRVIEVCFNCDEEFHVATRACQDIIEVVQEFAENGKYPFNVVMEMRFMADSDSYLCPAFIGNKGNGGSGHTMYINLLSFTNTPGWQLFCEQLLKKWQPLNPVLHLAKDWDFLDGGADYMRKTFAKQTKKFLAQLDKSGADPCGIFLNNTLQDVFFSGRNYPVYVEPEDNINKDREICVIL